MAAAAKVAGMPANMVVLDPDLIDACHLHHDDVYYGTNSDAAYRKSLPKRDYVNRGEMVHVINPEEEWFYKRLPMIQFQRTSVGGLLVDPTSVRVLIQNIWFGEYALGRDDSFYYPGILSLDACDYDTLSSDLGKIQSMSARLVLFLGRIYISMKSGHGYRAIHVPATICSFPFRFLPTVDFLAYSDMAKGKIGNGRRSIGQDGVSFFCMHVRHVFGPKTERSSVQPGSDVVFRSEYQAVVRKRKRSSATSGDHTLPPMKMCRGCMGKVYGNPPLTWVRLDMFPKYHSRWFIQEMVDPLQKNPVRYALIGAVAWQVCYPHNGYGEPVSTYCRTGHAFLGSPFEFIVRHMCHKNRDTCISLSKMAGPVIEMAVTHLLICRYQGMQNLFSDRCIPCLDYFGWCVYRPGKSSISIQCIVGRTPEGGAFLKGGGPVHDNSMLPQTPYQRIIVSKDVCGVTKSHTIVMETAQYLSWVCLRQGGVCVEMVVCAEDWSGKTVTEQRLGEKRPDMMCVNAETDFFPAVPRGTTHIVVSMSEYLDWAGFHWLLVGALNASGSSKITLEGSFIRASSGRLVCPYRCKKVGGLFSELVSVIGWASSRYGDDVVPTLTIAKRGAEAMPLSVSDADFIRSQVEGEVLSGKTLDVWFAVAGRYCLDEAWKTIGPNRLVVALWYSGVVLPEPIQSALSLEAERGALPSWKDFVS